jgi:uncharacterized protein YndB with AHSA1/START domain
MPSENNKKITVSCTIDAPLEKVWESWTEPEHIVNWTFASDDWQSPKSENDLQVGGKFLTRMEAKDGSFGFDFSGTYTKVEKYKEIIYRLVDDREVQILFLSGDKGTNVTEHFDPEETNSHELQQEGWQSILDNFKKYVETRE